MNALAISSYRWLVFAVLLSAPTLAPGCSCGEDPPPPMTCDSNEDCPGGLCGPEGRCIDGAECIEEQDCIEADPRKTCDPDTLTCEFRDGFADECDTERPCTFGQFCSSLYGRCFDASQAQDCTRRSQCPANQICDRMASKCVDDPGCFGDDFCEPGEVCDVINRTCRTEAAECVSCAIGGECEGNALCFTDTAECLAGGVEAVCAMGETCNPLGRCVQCTRSEDCGPGLFCNVSVGRCESNVQCADDPALCPSSSEVQCIMCVDPQVCDPRTRRCQAPATICETDIDCPGDQRCDMSVEPPVCVRRIPECLDDLLDEPPNDTIAQARTLEAGAGPLFEELKVCPGNQDWYRLDLEAGTFLTIDARFAQADGDIELMLFLADGQTLIDESRSTTDNERLQVEIGTPLTLYLRIFLAVPSVTPVPYQLVIARDPGELCDDDENEPDDGVADAKQLLSDETFEGRLCPADPDWFVLRNLTPGTRGTIELRFVDGLGDLDLELYRAGSTVPTRASRTLDDNESVTFDATFGGDYFVRVVGKAADTNRYTIRADLREGAAPTCVDDTDEPNNGPAEATTATTATGAINLRELTLCAQDEDWYEVELGAGEALQAEIGFSVGQDMELALYDGDTVDPDVTPLRVSRGLTPREFIAYRAPRDGSYLVRAYGHSEQTLTEYELRLTKTAFGPCLDDFVDTSSRGNTLMEAFPMPEAPSRLDELTLCPADEDWYELVLIGGFTNIIQLHFIESDAVLDLELYDGNGNSLIQTGGEGVDTKEIAVTVQGGRGLFYVRVFANRGFGTPYNLTVDLEPIFECANDVLEPNNIVARATTTTVAPSQTFDDLTMCTSVRDMANQGDEDWFRLVPTSTGTRMDATVEFDGGDLFLELFSPEANVRACRNFRDDRCYSDGLGLSESISFTATTTRPYFLRVGSIFSDPGVMPMNSDASYDLHIEYTEP